MAVGLPLKTTYANGDVYSASDVNDTNGTINITAAPYAAGKNKIINGDFFVWQRGTSFTPTTSTYTSDRWAMTSDGAGATRTITQQTFTLGTAPVSGYNGKFFLRYNQSVAGSGGSGNYLYQRIEGVRTFAGQTVTLSFWAKADAARVVSLTLGQLFGSGGSPSAQVDTSLGSVTLTTSWVRYTATVALPSISGKTLGTDGSDCLQVLLTYPTNATMTIDLWGVQLEASSVATAFQTATGTIQGEVAACQRYYHRIAGGIAGTFTTSGVGLSSTQTGILYPFKQSMRVTPTSIDYANLGSSDLVNATVNATLATLNGNTTLDVGVVVLTHASGITQYRPYTAAGQSGTVGYIGFSAEL